MACSTPIYITNRRGENIPVPCGRCYTCKKTITQQWIFRLMKEEEVSDPAYFVTLTYDTRSVPIKKPGLMSLKKQDTKDFIKRLRKDSKQLRYYLCGEYGTINKRPHYHAIIFNTEEHLIRKAWILNGVPKGNIDIGTVTNESIAYTVKYMDKIGLIPQFAGDEREKEFSLKSKGLGKNFLTKAMKKWMAIDFDNNYCKNGRFKVAMPKYYIDKGLCPVLREPRRMHIKEKMQELHEKDIERFYTLYPQHGGDYGRYLQYKEDNRKSIINKLKKQHSNRKL